MALYSKSSGGAYGVGNRNLRGAIKGSGRGRGKAQRGSRQGNKNAFYSTRVQDQHADAPETDGTETRSDEADSLEESAVSSSDNDDNLDAGITQPYSALLQSLNGVTTPGAPARKRRKLEKDDTLIRECESPKADLDKVEEVEETEDFGADDVENDEESHDYDPFSEHLDPTAESLETKIEAVRQDKWTTNKARWDSNWSCVSKVPQTVDASHRTDSLCGFDIEALSLKQKLKNLARTHIPTFDKLTENLALPIFRYQDILFPYRTLDNCDTLRKLTSLHALNHILKTRDKVIRGNARLSKEDSGEDLEFRDQGFTRPKVLILLPTRHACVKYVETIIPLCEPEQQENKKRFQDSYAAGEQVSADKPVDFQELFNGNDDDMFRLGLKITRKTIKFFAQFYNSDIVLASPLGLRMALGADDPKKQDNDFLSSIEIVIMDQAEAMLMQNWEHLEYVFDHLNLQPKEAHGCDFSRVRNWYLDGHARYLRQTILLSTFNFPSLNKLYAQFMLNVAGKLKYSQETDGVMTTFKVSFRQTFSRFESGMPVAEPENRFKYFATAVVPSLTKPLKYKSTGSQGVLIYLPTYSDFVRVRNYLSTSPTTQNISFGSISEYTSSKDVARARSHFLSGRHSVLLYTERAHHFRRYHLKGVKRVVMYGLPENPVFYQEIVGDFLGASIAAAKISVREAIVRVMFSKLDALKLERVVGTSRYISMLKEKGGDTFDFT
ncbi:rRNA-binding ribosome biosynthesis protein utp25 [Lecanora helva]